MESNKPIEAIIDAIELYIDEMETSTVYEVKCPNFIRHEKVECYLYPTKEELLKSL